jgi:peptidyl-prolyl cis-trans isomerase C
MSFAIYNFRSANAVRRWTIAALCVLNAVAGWNCRVSGADPITTEAKEAAPAERPSQESPEAESTTPEKPPAKPTPLPLPADDPPAAAYVNGEPIYVAEIKSGFDLMRTQRQISDAEAAGLQADLLRQLINRRLVVQFLKRDGGYVKQEDFDKAEKELAERIRAATGATIAEHAKKSQISEHSVQMEIYWKLAWAAYLQRNSVDALEGYFNEHRKDLDGTEVRVSHIVLRPLRANEAKEETTKRAAQLREEIESGRIGFEEAAKKYSAGPSRAQGGDLGFIPRNGAMQEPFAKASFALDKGKLSEPVTTQFGTHLIRVTDIKPGKRQWTQVIPQIQALAAVELFNDLAKQEDANAKIEYTGKAPYFKHGTEELVGPGSVKPKTP